MKVRTLVSLAGLTLIGSSLAQADSLSYTCDPSVSASVCTTLNSTISGIYTSTFSNINASIYIEYGLTSLGESTTGYDNQISYSAFVADLAAENGPGIVRTDALASLPAVEPALYDGAPIDISSALGSALGISGLAGLTANGNYCIVGTAGCFNGMIILSNNPFTNWYYRSGGSIDSDAYDFFTIVEHETDEVLGTTSCGTTGNDASIIDDCANAAVSPADLYRYNSGMRVFISTTVGAYFSYDGGATNGAGGALYNTVGNHADYGDFVTGCPASPRVQDDYGCPGHAGLDITNDGGAEINILDAVGYNLNQPSSVTPEPIPLTLVGPGLGLLALLKLRRCNNACKP
jgi:hypothetical protein